MVKGRWWPVWLCVLWLTGLAQASEISLRVAPDPPPAGESFELIFTAEGAVDDEPDFAPLARDFQILSRNQQTAITLLNGRHTRSTTWTVTVLPKQASPLLVPAISFGKLSTAPRQIALAPAGTGGGSDDDGLFLEVEASPERPYVQQEVIYTIRLWRRYEISNASLSQPTFSADVLVKPLDEDRRYEKNRDGKRYEVVERRFVLYPQVSGTLEIKPAEVTAQVVKRGFSLFDNFAQSMATRRITSKPTTLTVKPVPASFPGTHWLPARKLRLQEEWQPNPPQAAAGEPLTRTVTLWAEGLTAGQLPPIEIPAPAGWKAYPERPLTNDQQEDAGFHGVLAQKTALIANSSGVTEIPELRVPWWNTTTDRLEYARLPAATLRATAASDSSPPPVQTAPPPAAVATASTSSATPPAPPVGVSPGSTWHWLAALAALGWLLTLLLWWLQAARGAPAASAGVSDQPRSVEGQSVMEACRRGDAQAISRALLNWAARHWSEAPPRSLLALAARLPDALARPILQLDALCYGRTSAGFSAEELMRAWAATRVENLSRTATKEIVLPKLYPHAAD